MIITNIIINFINKLVISENIIKSEGNKNNYSIKKYKKLENAKHLFRKSINKHNEKLY